MQALNVLNCITYWCSPYSSGCFLPPNSDSNPSSSSSPVCFAACCFLITSLSSLVQFPARNHDLKHCRSAVTPGRRTQRPPIAVFAAENTRLTSNEIARIDSLSIDILDNRENRTLWETSSYHAQASASHDIGNC